MPVMPSLEKVIAKMNFERKKLQRQLGNIEGQFSKFGIRLGGSAPKGRPAKRGRVATKAKGKKGGKRRKFKQTAEKYILGLLKGGRSLTTAAINDKWQKTGRGGGSNVTLSKLVKSKQIKRHKAAGKKSVYSLK